MEASMIEDQEERKILRESILNNLKVKVKVEEWDEATSWPVWSNTFYMDVAAPTGTYQHHRHFQEPNLN